MPSHPCRWVAGLAAVAKGRRYDSHGDQPAVRWSCTTSGMGRRNLQQYLREHAAGVQQCIRVCATKVVNPSLSLNVMVHDLARVLVREMGMLQGSWPHVGQFIIPSSDAVRNFLYSNSTSPEPTKFACSDERRSQKVTEEPYVRGNVEGYEGREPCPGFPFVAFASRSFATRNNV